MECQLMNVNNGIRIPPLLINRGNRLSKEINRMLKLVNKRHKKCGIYIQVLHYKMLTNYNGNKD